MDGRTLSERAYSVDNRFLCRPRMDFASEEPMVRRLSAGGNGPPTNDQAKKAGR